MQAAGERTRGAYGGDALIEDIEPGGERLLANPESISGSRRYDGGRNSGGARDRNRNSQKEHNFSLYSK